MRQAASKQPPCTKYKSAMVDLEMDLCEAHGNVTGHEQA
jgi:hypothetical protein